MSDIDRGARIPYRNDEFEQVHYDLLKEFTYALLFTLVLILVLAGVFSTPDVPYLSAKQVAVQQPLLLVANELDDLSGASSISTYGPPYNSGNQSVQSMGGFSPQSWMGIQIPVNPKVDNVLNPLRKSAIIHSQLNQTLSLWSSASTAQQNAWVTAVQHHLSQARINHQQLVLPRGVADYGPVPVMINSYLTLARSGLLEDAIDGASGPGPNLNRTKSLLLLQDDPDHNYAQDLNMLGEQWGVIKETGNYPGAVWLWFYTFLYQIPPFNSSASGDLLVVVTVAIVTLILILLPFIPGLRSIPRGLGVYRLIWRGYYRRAAVKK